MSKRKTGPPASDSTAQEAAVSGEPPAVVSATGISENPNSTGAFGRNWKLVLSALLFVLVIGVFFPVLRNGAVNFDDQTYVFANNHVRQGLNWNNIRWAFQSFQNCNWHPLTWISHMMDCQIYGLNPWGHHLTNLLLHAVNTLLLFVLLNRLTGAVWRSFFVAALFGLHPLRVESVAWIAERKDDLSTLFWMLALLSYAAYSGQQGKKPHLFYLAALLSFAAGLLCKPMLVTLPFVLLLLDYWPLQRSAISAGNAGSTVWSWPRLILEKTPFFFLAAASCAITFIAQQRGGAVRTGEELALLPRIENILVSYPRYFGKIFYPANLSVFYPYPAHWPIGLVALAGLFLIGVTILAVALRRRLRWLPVGWFWFLGTLVPVIGIVQVGQQSIADRYTLIPSIGIAILTVWGVAEMTKSWRFGAVPVSIASVAALSICGVLTRQQIGYWENSETLFRRAIATGAGNHSLPHLNLAGALIEQGRFEEGIAEYREAVRLNPGFWLYRTGLGIALRKAGKLDEAESQLADAERLNPDDATTHSELGLTLCGLGHPDEGIAELQQAVTRDPDSSPFHYNYGNGLLALGRVDDAIAEFEKSLRLEPSSGLSHAGLGTAYRRKGRLDDALAELRIAAQLSPGEAAIHRELGAALQLQGHLDLALIEFETAVKLNPNDARTREEFGTALGRSGRLDEAIKEFEAAAQSNPRDANARIYLGVALAQKGDLDGAIAQFDEAVRLNPRLPEARKNLATALVGKGRVEEAILQLRTALQLRPNYPEAERQLRELTRSVAP